MGVLHIAMADFFSAISDLVKFRLVRNKKPYIGLIVFVLVVSLITVVVNSKSPYDVSGAKIVIVVLMAALLIEGVIWTFDYERKYYRARSFSLDTSSRVRALDVIIAQGTIDYDQNNRAVIITDSDAGCMIKNREWRFFNVTFDVLVTNDNGFGFLFRAKALDHYLMFKFNPGQSPRFHFRYKYGWEILAPVGAVISLKPNQWTHFDITLDKHNDLTVQIDSYVFTARITNEAILNYIAASFLPKGFGPDPNERDKSLLVPIDELQSGSVGFRTYNDEKILFKNLKVKPL